MAESRQVRRARERAEAKGLKSSASTDAILAEFFAEQEKRNAEREAFLNRPPVSIEPDPTSHPGRYPVHKDTAKGQVYDGECNRTACTNTGSRYWNRGTFGFYCLHDARAINEGHPDPLCILVEAKPSFEEMEVLRKTHDPSGFRI